jgi:hypothetical protein
MNHKNANDTSPYYIDTLHFSGRVVKTVLKEARVVVVGMVVRV